MGEETATTINFRPMTAADILSWYKIEAESFYDAWNDSMLLNELNNNLTTYLVMTVADRIVGYAGFWLVAGEAQITRVAVRTVSVVRALWYRLTATLVNKAWELGADAITLEVRESNVAA